MGGINVLDISQVEQHWYSDIFRSILWSIAKGILNLLDGFFNVINKIWQYDFFNNEYVDKIFSGAIIVASTWLILKVVIELVMNYIVKNEGRDTPLSAYRGILFAIIMMFLIPYLFQFGHAISSGLTNSVLAVYNIDESTNVESTISNSLVESMIYKNETKSEHVSELIRNWKTIDINATEDGILGFGDVYKYSLNFFMLIVLSIITIFLLFFVAIQMAKRVLEIALYKIIGPFCATSLTSQNKTFELWCKSTMGAFLVTVVQFIGIGLLLTLFGSAFQETGTLTGIFLVIGALLFIISTPTLINSLLNQQSGMMAGFGDLQSIIAIGHLTGQGIGLASAGLSSALSIGSTVFNSSSKLVNGGISRISNMMNNNKLNPEQMSIVKDSISSNNSYKAQNQVKEFLNENKKTPTFNNNQFNNLNHLSNMHYNTMKDNFISKDKGKL